MRLGTLFIYYPLLLLFAVLSIAGIFIALKKMRNKNEDQVALPTILFVIGAIIIANGIIFFIRGPIPTRHIREIISLLAPFIALGLLGLFRYVPIKKTMLIIGMVCALGITQEFAEFGRYEKYYLADWDYLTFYSWLEKNVPQDAKILTDRFTLHTIFPALPYAQPPKENEAVRAKLGPGFDARQVVFSGKKDQFPIALQLNCPDYIVIDRSNTMQFYPNNLEDAYSQFKDLITLVYSQKTRTSLISVWEVLPKACNP